MIKVIKKASALLSVLWMTSCSDIAFGDKFLGDQPESSGATLEIMFSNKENANKVLTKAYTGLIYGLSTNSVPRLGGNVLESLTDLCHSYRMNIGDGPNNLYYNGQLSANNVPGNAAYQFGGASDWTTIRYAWIFIENVNKVPDMTDSEKSEKKAEAQVLIALSYFRMMRYIGGVPWLDHAIEVNEPLNFPRKTFAETVENIVALLDESKDYLKWKQPIEQEGRMTKAAALGLKFQVLLWAASPTFNSNTLWHAQADEYTCYGNYDKKRWERAKAAGAEFFNELERNGGYELIQPEEETHRARRLAYRKAYYDRGGTEIIISIRKGYNNDTHNMFYQQRLYPGPTLNFVNMFPWEDGTDFAEDFNWEQPSRQPFFEERNGELIPTRDPRLYENVAVPGDIYFNGTTAPLHVNHPSYKPGSGFLMMKFALQEGSDRANRPVQWSYLRLPELMLSYAEVLNELAGQPTAEAYQLVNDVRARVGLSALPNKMSKKDFAEILLRERALELGFEEIRWFDLVRYSRQQDFTKQLYGLQSKGEDNMNQPKKFSFKKVKLDRTRYWVDNWDSKWFLSPIPQNEINKKYGMTQNPGW